MIKYLDTNYNPHLSDDLYIGSLEEEEERRRHLLGAGIILGLAGAAFILHKPQLLERGAYLFSAGALWYERASKEFNRLFAEEIVSEAAEALGKDIRDYKTLQLYLHPIKSLKEYFRVIKESAPVKLVKTESGLKISDSEVLQYIASKNRLTKLIEDVETAYQFIEKQFHKEVGVPPSIISKIDIRNRLYIEAFKDNKQLRFGQYRSATLRDLIERPELSVFLPDSLRHHITSTHSTINRLIDIAVKHGKTSDTFTKRIKSMEEQYEKLLDLVIDPWFLIHENPDVEPARAVLNLSTYNIAKNFILKRVQSDFQVPFVKLNPISSILDMLGIEPDDVKKNAVFIRKGVVNPLIEYSTEPLKNNYVFIRNKLYQLEFGKGSKDRYGTISLKLLRSGRIYNAEFESGHADVIRRLIGVKKFPNEDRNRLFKLLDIGEQETRPEKVDLFSVDTWIFALNKLTGRIFKSPVFNMTNKQMEEVTNRILRDVFLYSEEELKSHSVYFFAPKIYRSWKDVIDPRRHLKLIKSLIFGSRTNLKAVTHESLTALRAVTAFNAMLSNFGLGLGPDSQRSILDFILSLYFKRILPVQGIFFVANYLNYLVGRLDRRKNAEGEFESREIDDRIARQIRDWQLKLARKFERHGITNIFKRDKQLFPGYEYITELPVLPLPSDSGIQVLKLGELFPFDKTAKELEKWYETGTSPVRKGRYWSTGNTPFIGGKISYFEPNWFRKIQSEWKYTDVLYGLKYEYFKFGTPIPNPVEPLAPIRYFILNRYWLENKHREDRPYPYTVGYPFIENIPIIGPVLNRTLGFLLRHRAYPTKDLLIYAQQEYLNKINVEQNNKYLVYLTASRQIEIAKKQKEQQEVFDMLHEIKRKQFKNPILHKIQEIYYQLTQRLGLRNARFYSFQYPVTEPIIAETTLRRRNYILDKLGLSTREEEFLPISSATAKEVRKRIRPYTDIYGKFELRGTGQPPQTSSFESISQTLASLHNLISNISEYRGLRGFLTSTVLENVADLAGLDLSQIKMLPDSSMMYSPARMFWNQELGGYPGELSELIRRILQKPPRNIYNPIPNTMPSWLPGDEGFINFRRGDPYIKIPQGELRLPGAAYARLWKLDEEFIKKNYPEEYEKLKQIPYYWQTRRFRQLAKQLSFEDYPIFHKFQILADVAPFSPQFEYYNKLIDYVLVERGQRQLVKQIREQLRQRYKIPMYDYRFLHQNRLERKVVTVKDVTASGYLITEEFPYNPIRFAGINNRQLIYNRRAVQILRKLKGERVVIEYDPTDLENLQEFGTIPAIVRHHFTNVNRLLMEKGIEEAEDDFSAAAVKVRFSGPEILLGRLWEAFAHMDTPLHTKFLQVRSPYEQYRRREVYGKDYQTWEHPIRDYLIPTFESFISHTPVTAGLLGAFLGTLFSRTPFAKITFGLIGGISSFVGSTIVKIKEFKEQEAWIPERRRKQRAVEEIYDALKYIKYRHLYEYYSQLALTQEGFDVEKFEQQQEREGKKIKDKVEQLRRKKFELMVEFEPGEYKPLSYPRTIPGKIKRWLWEHFTIKGRHVGKLRRQIKEINQQLEELQSDKRLVQIPYYAQLALYYKQQIENTMVGFDYKKRPAYEFAQVLPEKERQYFTAFLNAPVYERKKILKIVPDYMRPVLKYYWGMDEEPRQTAEDILRKYRVRIPQNFVYFAENVPMEPLRVKLIQRYRLDPSDFGYYEEEVKQIEQQQKFIENAGKRINSHYDPNRRVRDSIIRNRQDLIKQVHDMLTRQGFKNIRFIVKPVATDTVDITMTLYDSREGEFIKHVSR